MRKETIEEAVVNPINFFNLQRVTDSEKISRWISILINQQDKIQIAHQGNLTSDIAKLFAHLAHCYKDLLAGSEENLIPDLIIPLTFEEYSTELTEFFKKYGILLTFYYAEPGTEFRSPGGTLRSSWKATAKLIPLKDAE